MRIIRFDHLKPAPWKNGGGITREIAAMRKQSDICWRISMADVEIDGPFSEFNGLTRILTVMSGNGIELIGDQVKIEALYAVPVEFDGGLALQSRLIDGPIRDLNVMFDAQLYDCKVALIETSMMLEPLHTLAIIGLNGISQITSGQDFQTHELEYGDTALIEYQRLSLILESGAAALMVAFNLRR